MSLTPVQLARAAAGYRVTCPTLRTTPNSSSPHRSRCFLQALIRAQRFTFKGDDHALKSEYTPKAWTGSIPGSDSARSPSAPLPRVRRRSPANSRPLQPLHPFRFSNTSTSSNGFLLLFFTTTTNHSNKCGDRRTHSVSFRDRNLPSQERRSRHQERRGQLLCASCCSIGPFPPC